MDEWREGVSEWVQITTKRLKGVTGVERERERERRELSTVIQGGRYAGQRDAQTHRETERKEKEKRAEIYAPNST